MKPTSALVRKGLIGWVLLCLWISSLALAQGIPGNAPEDFGFSSERLARLQDLLSKRVEEGKYAGAVSLILREGAVVDFFSCGMQDLEKKIPMQKDAIFRIYSMSKVVTSVAVMALFEEGRFRLDDPVSNYLPELKSMRVFKGGTADQPEFEDARKPITIKHLLTHTSGLTYDFGTSPVEQMYKNVKLWEAISCKDFLQRVSKIPLVSQPGETWTYGINTDVLGCLVEAVSGQSFEEFLSERIFKPLQMVDTGFSVPDPKLDRLAQLYEAGPDGKLKVAAPVLNLQTAAKPKFCSGGGGLFSTVPDYARFAAMLLDGGRLDNAQILGRKTVELMTANHLNHMSRQTTVWSESEGFGLGGSVRIDLAKGNSSGSVGQFGWTGAATTYFNIDPRERTVVLLFLQHLPHDQYGLFPKYSTLFYSSMVE
jgi:CubicO group peptidase (beta-lactamase class C family)